MEATRALAAILSVLLALALLAYSPKITESLKAPSLKLTSIDENPQFLWANRRLDLLIQAFMILAAAMAISAQLRKEERVREVEEK